MPAGAVLVEIEALPGPERAGTGADRQRQLDLREDGPDVGGHVVRSLVAVLEEPIAVGDQSGHEGVEVAPHGRVGVFAENQGCAGVMDEDVTESDPDSRGPNLLLDAPGDVVGAPAMRGDRERLLQDHSIS